MNDSPTAPGILLDADTLSDVLNGRSAVEARFWRYLRDHERVPVAAPALYEVLEGLTRVPKPRKSADLGAMRSILDVIPFSEDAAALAGEIAGKLNRTGLSIGKIDPQIAAIALAEGRTLVTGNTRHFERVRTINRTLALENWRT